MLNILEFIEKHRFFASAMLVLNLFLVWVLIMKIGTYMNSQVIEAMGGRIQGRSLYKRCTQLIVRSINEYERRDKKPGFYIKAKDKVRKAGYKSEAAASIYLILKYVVPVFFFIGGFIVNFPNATRPLLLALCLHVIVELVVSSRRKEMNLRFQRYVYKIYKFLHNQISSGVKVNDALKTVYQIIEDREIRQTLIKLAAAYELTLSIDNALEEFSSCFDNHEAQTLCVALKQGVETGDNQDLLARQEQVMFNKYFNYIQAETDSCAIRSVIAVVMFTSIIVIMIAVPLINDAADAVGKIFVS